MSGYGSVHCLQIVSSKSLAGCVRCERVWVSSVTRYAGRVVTLLSAILVTPWIASSYAFADCPSGELAKLIPAGGAAGDNFGIAVDVKDDVCVVGAPGVDSVAGVLSGAGYVFEFDGVGNWIQQAKLESSQAGPDDLLGLSVAIGDDVIALGAVNASGGHGAVLVYERPPGGWTDGVETAILTASDGAVGDRFGIDVSIDGDTILVGASENNGVGAAYVFVRPPSGWSDTTETAKLTASIPQVGDELGRGVRLLGAVALVGAPGAQGQSGAVLEFREMPTGWESASEVAIIVPSDPAPGQNFGRSIDLDSSRALIGAPGDASGGVDAGAAYVFASVGDGYAQSAKLVPAMSAAGAQFGRSVSLSGGLALIGQPYLNQGPLVGAGAAVAFMFDGTLWNEEARLTASDAAPGDNFGVAVSAGGFASFVGANGDNAAGGADRGACYVMGGIFDCNVNGVLDICDIISGFSEDTNQNLVPDECVIWDGGAQSTSWNDAANWLDNFVPGVSPMPETARESPVIQGDGVVVDLDVQVSVDSVLLGAGANLNIMQLDLTLDSSQGIENDGLFRMLDVGDLIASAPVVLRGLEPIRVQHADAEIRSVTPGDVVTILSGIRGEGLITASILNQGVIAATMPGPGAELAIDGPNPKTNNGLLLAEAGASLTIRGAGIVGDGQLLADRGTIQIDTTVTDSPGPPDVGLTASGGTIGIGMEEDDSDVDGCGPIIGRPAVIQSVSFPAQVTVRASALRGASEWIIGDEQTAPGATALFELLDNAFGQVAGPVTLAQNGTLRLRNSDLDTQGLDIAAGGVLEGSGSVMANLSSSGTIRANRAGETLTVHGAGMNQLDGNVQGISDGRLVLEGEFSGGGVYLAAGGTVEVRARLFGDTPITPISFFAVGGAIIIEPDDEDDGGDVDGCGPVIGSPVAGATNQPALIEARDASLQGASEWVIGDFQVGSGLTATFNLLNGTQAGVNGPVTVRQNGTLRLMNSSLVAEELILDPGATLIVGSSIAVASSFQHELDNPADWQWADGSVFVMTGGTGVGDPYGLDGWLLLESASPDDGPLPGNEDFHFAVFELADGAHVNLVDYNANGGSGATQAVYCDELRMSAGAILNLNEIALYVGGVLLSSGPWDQGDITDDIRRYLGDLNGDGLFNIDDLDGFVEVLTGVSDEPALVAACDLNQDGLTNGGDIAAFVGLVLSE